MEVLVRRVDYLELASTRTVVDLVVAQENNIVTAHRERHGEVCGAVWEGHVRIPAFSSPEEQMVTGSPHLQGGMGDEASQARRVGDPQLRNYPRLNGRV